MNTIQLHTNQQQAFTGPTVESVTLDAGSWHISVHNFPHKVRFSAIKKHWDMQIYHVRDNYTRT